MGIDYGLRRIGLSVGDGALRVATPLPAIVNGPPFLETLRNVIDEQKIGVFVLGLPLRENGEPSRWTGQVQTFGELLMQTFSLPLRWSDECLTSYQVDMDRRHWRLREKYADMLAMRRTGRLDSQAAVLILQDFFDNLPQEEV